VACPFEVASPNGARARVRRDGELVTPAGWRGGTLELPVWGHRHVFGQFVLEFPPGAALPSRRDLIAAMTLGDQVGAAFMTQAPSPPDPGDEPARDLRIVR
jgi:hypothetical protein